MEYVEIVLAIMETVVIELVVTLLANMLLVYINCVLTPSPITLPAVLT